MLRQLLFVLSLCFLVSSVVESASAWKSRWKRSNRRLLDVLRNPSGTMDMYEKSDRTQAISSYFQLMTRIGDKVAKERQRVGYPSLLPFIATKPSSSPVLCQVAKICDEVGLDSDFYLRGGSLQ
uniref:Uncharacterized protein n=1 Tax=Plectus sambesii TaxID=2011161 RepID=A0A914WFV7_9BILA